MDEVAEIPAEVENHSMQTASTIGDECAMAWYSGTSPDRPQQATYQSGVGWRISISSPNMAETAISCFGMRMRSRQRFQSWI